MTTFPQDRINTTKFSHTSTPTSYRQTTMKSIDAKAILTNPNVDITNIFGEGTYYGESVIYFPAISAQGNVVLSKVRDRAKGSRQNNSVNNLSVSTLNEAAALLTDNNEQGVGYYIWLKHKTFRNQYAPQSLTFEYRLENETSYLTIDL